MKVDFFPILVVPAVPYDGGIRFLHRNEQIDIEPAVSDEVWKIIGFCNGRNNLEEISKLAALSLDDVSEIIQELIELELVIDSREQFIHFHRICNYPTTFSRYLTQDEVRAYTISPRKAVKEGRVLQFKKDENTFFSKVLRKRRSCRSFSDKLLTLDQIGSICHYAYCIDEHVVPSGGALYPLKIYVTIEKAQGGIKAGYYEYDAEKDVLILFNEKVDEEQLKYCFNQERMPFGSSVQIIIAADLRRQTFKYANRGYMLTQVEIGHVAENINLYCAENGIGACEMGGIQDEPLKNELELDEDVWPFIAIPIGYCAETETHSIDEIRYVEEMTGEKKPVKEFWARTFDNDGSFFGAVATYKDGFGDTQFAGATSASYAKAFFKATIEGYERWVSSKVRIDYHGKADDLENWADPRLLAPLTTEQAKKCRVKTFFESLEIDWTIGKKYNGEEIFVPSDLVYYGQKPSKNRIYVGNSSGVAAYTNFEEAQKRAITELIERDAIMQNWYTRKAPNIINKTFLPIHVQKRIEHWSNQDRKMLVLEMTSDYGWVFETIIISKQHPCFVSGAAATIVEEDIPKAIIKSVQEAEYSLLLELDNPDYSEIEPSSVFSPVEHGKVYHLWRHAKTLSWLWSNTSVGGFTVHQSLSTDELISKLEAITIDLSEVKSDLKVVRVLSPKLVPINFGFNSAHYTHLALKGKIHSDSLNMPHYFA